MATVAEKRRTFRALHESGCFVIPNPWDVGTARYLQRLGFKALATTSSGAAWSLGYADGEVPLDAMLDHIRTIAAATDLPVNADFLAGFADAPHGVAANVRAASRPAWPACRSRTPPAMPRRRCSTSLWPSSASRRRARRSTRPAVDVMLVARTECYLTGHADPLNEAIRRLTAFAEAGADCLYAPGPRTREDIAAIVKAVAPKPVNVLARGPRWAVGPRSGRSRRAADQRRRGDGAHGVGRVHARGARDRRGRATSAHSTTRHPGGELDALLRESGKA